MKQKPVKFFKKPKKGKELKPLGDVGKLATAGVTAVVGAALIAESARLISRV